MKPTQIFTLLISAVILFTSCNSQEKKKENSKPIKQITETYYEKRGNNLVPVSASAEKVISIRPYYQFFMPSDFFFPYFNENDISEIHYIFQNNKVISCNGIGYRGKRNVFNYHYNSDGSLSAIEKDGSQEYSFIYSKDLIEFYSNQHKEYGTTKLFIKGGKVYKSVDRKNGEWDYTYANKSIIADVYGEKIVFNYNTLNELESINADDINLTYTYTYDAYQNWTTQEIEINEFYNEDTNGVGVFVVKREIIYE